MKKDSIFMHSLGSSLNTNVSFLGKKKEKDSIGIVLYCK